MISAAAGFSQSTTALSDEIQSRSKQAQETLNEHSRNICQLARRARQQIVVKECGDLV